MHIPLKIDSASVSSGNCFSLKRLLFGDNLTSRILVHPLNAASAEVQATENSTTAEYARVSKTPSTALISDSGIEQAVVTPQETSRLSVLRVLVVDDDSDSRELVAFILEQHQIQVIIAASAAEAFDLLSRLAIDMLISDIKMPGEDGYSLMQRIRTHPSTQKSQIPAIALTALAREVDRQASLAAGFQQHLTKPVGPDELIAIVTRLVDLLR